MDERIAVVGELVKALVAKIKCSARKGVRFTLRSFQFFCAILQMLLESSKRRKSGHKTFQLKKRFSEEDSYAASSAPTFQSIDRSAGSQDGDFRQYNRQNSVRVTFEPGACKLLSPF